MPSHPLSSPVTTASHCDDQDRSKPENKTKHKEKQHGSVHEQQERKTKIKAKHGSEDRREKQPKKDDGQQIEARMKRVRDLKPMTKKQRMKVKHYI